MNEEFTKGFIAIVVGAIALGTAAIFMRLAEVTPTAAAFWRIALALPLLYLWMKLDKKTRAQTKLKETPKYLRASFIVGLWFAADLFLWHWSVEKTTIANATLLANMATIFTALAGFLFLGQRFQKKFLVGIGCALLGAFILVGQNANINPDFLLGDMLALLTAVAYSGYIIYGAKVRGSLTTPTVMFGSAFATASLLLPIALLENGPFIPKDLHGWLPLIGLAWFTHIFGQSLVMYGLAHVPPALGSVTLLTQPVVSAMLAWWIFAEALGLSHLVGALFILAGIYLARLGSKQKTSLPSAT